MQRYAVFVTAVSLMLSTAACSDSKNANDVGGADQPAVSSSEPSTLAASQSDQSVNDNADTSANAQNYGSSGYGFRSMHNHSMPPTGDPHRGGRDNGPGHQPTCMHAQGAGGGAINPGDANAQFSLSFSDCQTGDQNGTTMNGNCTVSVARDPNDPNHRLKIGFGGDANHQFPDGSTMNVHGLPPGPNQPAVTVDTNGTIAANGNSTVTRTISATEHRIRTLNGNVMFDMNVTYVSVVTVDSYTDGALVSRVINGETTVHHNRLHMTSTHAFSNVTEVFGSCDCYPVSGTVEQTTTLDSDPNTVVLDRTFTYTSACGVVDVATTVSTDPNILTGDAKLTLDACNN